MTKVNAISEFRDILNRHTDKVLAEACNRMDFRDPEAIKAITAVNRLVGYLTGSTVGELWNQDPATIERRLNSLRNLVSHGS